MTGEIRWLVIEREDSSHGWLLLEHRSLAEPSKFDSWLLARGEAQEHARQQFGVASAGWRAEGD